MSEQIAVHTPRLFTVATWPNPWPTQSGWRHYAFESESNGMDAAGVFLRLGKGQKNRRLLIDEDAFYVWARKHGQR